MSMTSGTNPQLENLTPPVLEGDERWLLVQSVAASPAFQKSNRLRELLLYIGERSLRDPAVAIREQELGVEVFGRPAHFDTSQDTLVRVQASQLRKKLQKYFDEEASGESVVLEIPKGAYTLVFRPRFDQHPPSATNNSQPVFPQPVHYQPWLIAGSILLLSLACIALALQNRELRHQLTFGLGPSPAVKQLWKQVFDNNRHSYLVLADANLMTFQDVIEHQVTLSEYQNKSFEPLAARLPDPHIADLLMRYLGRNATTAADANIAKRMALVFAANQLTFNATLAREMTTSQITSDNTILMGSRRANPWGMLYEDKLNFQTAFSESPRKASFINKSPAAGEAAEYVADWSRRSYCRVAFLNNTKGTGNVILISGTDVFSSEAGAEFVTSEAAIEQLRHQFGLKSADPMPHFEVLLQTDLVNNTVSQYKVVAVRRK